MNIKKIRFIEPGNLPYKRSFKNLYTYEKYIRNPSIGLMTLATLAKEEVDDTYMYSESISKIRWQDVLAADIVFIGIFTFSAPRGYELAQYIRENSQAVVVLGGLHASLNYEEAVEYADYVLLGDGDESILEFLRTLKKGQDVTFPGVAYKKDGAIVHTGERQAPKNIDVVPNRYLLHNYKKMAGHNTLWPQVHASRGCPHNCDYCAVVRHFGRVVRKRSPENIVADIREAIEFHKGFFRMAKVLWITDDNFFADREWAVEVLEAIIASGIKYKFTIQARYEVGFDDEMLELLKRAGFIEIAMGIEFLEDESFDKYHKKSSYQEIVDSVKNIQKHGLGARGLFILGAENHTIGVGDRLADFVIKHEIHGVLIQSMYFVPGTPVYEMNKDNLIHEDWSRYNGNVVHYPKNMTPYELQLENIKASRKIYSRKNLWRALFKRRWIDTLLFIGEYFWQKSVRSSLKKELSYLKTLEK